MPRTVEFLNDMPAVRAALSERFQAFFHVTGYRNLAGVRELGLVPHMDSEAPDDVLIVTQTSKILCLRPMGSEQEPRGLSEPPLMTLAVLPDALPARLGLDWSYSYELQRRRMKLHSDRPLAEFVSGMAHELGSIVSYDVIPPEHLRVRCIGCSDDPKTWPLLTTVTDEQIFKHE